MYVNNCLEICKAENGYVVEVCVPMDASKGESSDMPMSSEDNDKQFIAKDIAEVQNLVAKLMPLMDTSFSTMDEFTAAFDKAAK